MIKTRKLNAVIALEIILSMTLYYFLLVGFTAITYAIDLVETNNHNVDLSAYFVNANGEKTSVIEKSINEREYLYVDVMVKNEGYLNGYISLSNHNFNIVQDIQCEGIEEISGNFVKLKQINSGLTQTIKLLVEPVKDDRINRSYFNANTDVVLTGEYLNSKNIESEKNTQIYGTAPVQLLWKSSQDISAGVEANVLTNSIYDLNGEQKRVVQILINSGVRNNEYPINKSTIKINGLRNAENVKVFARSTDATNDQFIFTEGNYNYDKTNNTITLNVENNATEVISWKKDCIDTFVITYVLNKDEVVNNENIFVNGRIETFDNKTLEANTNVVINEEKDGIVTGDLVLKESSIYKGKIYTGEERLYQTESKIYINSSDIANKVLINDKSPKYIQNDIEVDTNIIYKSTSISRDNFINVLGVDGYITVKDENGSLIGNININTEANENGILTLNYNTDVRGLIIETSKPITEGTLRLGHTKAIINSGLPREIINNLTGIKEGSIVKYDNSNPIANEKTIELRNTSTKAKFEVEADKLLANTKNENVKMTVTLENSNEARDLYQNPVVRIKLPSQVKNVGLKCKLMYNNGLEISNAQIVKENENFVLEFALQGTQTVYNANVVDGTSIIIYADMEIDENAVNSNEEFVMNYTNELATSFEDNGEERIGVYVEGISPEVKAMLEAERVRIQQETERMRIQELQEQVVTNLKAYVGGQELANGATVYTGEVVKYEITVKNNTNAALENVNIQALVPEGTKLVERISDETTRIDKYVNRQVENNMITKSIERINHSGNNKVVLSYEIQVDEDTQVNRISNTLQVSYNNTSKQDTIEFAVEKAQLQLGLFMKFRPGAILTNEIEYSYILYVKNTSDSDLQNVNINIDTTPSLKFVDFADGTDFRFLTDSNSYTIDRIEAGKTATYLVNVKTDKSGGNIGEISVTANNTYHSNRNVENINSLDIEAHLDSSNKGEEVKFGDDIIYNLNIKNTSNIVQNSFTIDQIIPSCANVKSITINGEELEYAVYEKFDTGDEGEVSDYYNYIVEYNYNNEINPGNEVTIIINTEITEDDEENLPNISSSATVNNQTTETVAHILAIVPSNEQEDQEDEEVIPDDDKGPIDYEEEEEPVNPGDAENPEEPTDSDDPNGEENPSDSENDNNSGESTDGNSDNNGNNDNKKYSISGKVWLDENGNGKRDSNEKDMNDVQVTLLNVDTNQKQTAKGAYQFTNLAKGRYIAIFDYDTTKYNLTKYQAEGVSKELNSDVERNKISIDGKEQILATTDILDIANNDITNIDLGLVIAKNFDLELTKTISKVTISNTEGKSVKEYNDEKLAKVEIGAKYLKNSTVVIEYSIKVKNAGEMAGYAQQIVDYKPTDLKFNSSLNADWYQSGEYLYSNALEKTKIEPGETKELKLILTKEMTESNTGLTNNMAEINKSISVNNTTDSDSTPGNKKSKEDDLGQANVIISVKTGAAVSYILVSIFILVMTALGGYFINKKFMKYLDK